MFRLLADEVVLHAYDTTAVVSIHAEACLNNPKETNLLARDKKSGGIFTYLTVNPSAVRTSVGGDIFGSPTVVFVKAYGKNGSLWTQLSSLNIISPIPDQTFVIDNMGSCIHAVRLLG